ncbi:MAG: hypothetical protein LBI02_08540 [Opitutaceae bacterium]|nr:hypothetical protein [Opitutaceae bacterium]
MPRTKTDGSFSPADPTAGASRASARQNGASRSGLRSGFARKYCSSRPSASNRSNSTLCASRPCSAYLL